MVKLFHPDVRIDIQTEKELTEEEAVSLVGVFARQKRETERSEFHHSEQPWKGLIRYQSNACMNIVMSIQSPQ